MREVEDKPAKFLPFASDVHDLSHVLECHSHLASRVKKPGDHEYDETIIKIWRFVKLTSN